MHVLVRDCNNVGQLSAFIQAHNNHMASPAAAGSSRKRKRVVLSLEDKLKICDLAESGRSGSIIRHTNEHYCSFLSQTGRKRLQTFEQTKISDELIPKVCECSLMSVIRTFHLSELSQSHCVRISDFLLYIQQSSSS